MKWLILICDEDFYNDNVTLYAQNGWPYIGQIFLLFYLRLPPVWTCQLHFHPHPTFCPPFLLLYAYNMISLLYFFKAFRFRWSSPIVRKVFNQETIRWYINPVRFWLTIHCFSNKPRETLKMSAADLQKKQFALDYQAHRSEFWFDLIFADEIRIG